MRASLVLALVLAGCARDEVEAATSSGEPARPVEAAAEPAAQEPSLLEQLLELDDAQAVFAVVAPQIGQQIDELSPATVLFGLWAAHRLRWSDVHVELDETSIKLTKKDPETARGKRLCWSGRIIQIRREPGIDPPIFEGTMGTGRGDVFHYLAVGSTGELVEGSRARLCGFVTGVYAYKNIGGGQTQAVQLVGMFKLPENTGR